MGLLKQTLENEFYATDPPVWYVPSRQLLGNALLRAGRAAEAIVVFQEDLRGHPKNGWSLKGLAEAFRAVGDLTKEREALQQLNQAWRWADGPRRAEPK